MQTARGYSSRLHVRIVQYSYSVFVTSTLLAKLVRLGVYWRLITPANWTVWAPTFFTWDLLIVLAVRALAVPHPLTGIAWRISFTSTILLRYSSRLAHADNLYVDLTSSVEAAMQASMDIAFYSATGQAIPWHDVLPLLTDMAGGQVVLWGFAYWCFGLVVIMVLSVLLMPIICDLAGNIVDCVLAILKRLVFYLGPRCFRSSNGWLMRYPCPQSSGAFRVGQHNYSEVITGQRKRVSQKQSVRTGLLALALLFLRVIRPRSDAYLFLSHPAVMLPFMEARANGLLDVGLLPCEHIIPLSCSTLAAPSKLDWLPTRNALAGFDDWYEDQPTGQRLHYDPSGDCFHTSNLDTPIIAPIQDSLTRDDIKIKHIMVIFLESTRQDLFPLVRNNHIWSLVADTFGEGNLPPDVERELENLTPNAAWLSGERGGGSKGNWGALTVTDAMTTSSYTLKSFVGSLCGVHPLTLDFNQEYKHHIHQPCLSHILAALNIRQQPVELNNFSSWPWRSIWMQSSTMGFDHQFSLTNQLGYEAYASRETLFDASSTHFPPKSKDVNYFGLMEKELEPYLRDLFVDAEQNQKRLFLTHLTSSTHHPWNLPKEFTLKRYLRHITYGYSRKFNRYLNTIKLVDNWLGEILSILEETGVANETLLILTGDHGLSLPDDGGDPIDNPHVGHTHVPLIYAHRGLPKIRINDTVSSAQILPTVLDLLSASGSLDEEARQKVKDLLPIYEGQSMLRRQKRATKDGRPIWHFSVINTGGSWVVMYSSTATFRLAVPLRSNFDWRFSDLLQDPHEMDPLRAYDLFDLYSKVIQQHGRDAAPWLCDAVGVARWWVRKNRRLWRCSETTAT